MYQCRNHINNFFWKWQYFKTNSRNGAWGILLFGLSLKHDKMTVGGILMAHWVFWSTHERSWPSPQWLVVIMDHVLLRYWIMTLKLCTLQSSVLHTRLGCNTVTLSHNTIIAQQRHFRYNIICKKIVSMCFLWLLIRNVIGVSKHICILLFNLFKPLFFMPRSLKITSVDPRWHQVDPCNPGKMVDHDNVF